VLQPEVAKAQVSASRSDTNVDFWNEFMVGEWSSIGNYDKVRVCAMGSYPRLVVGEQARGTRGKWAEPRRTPLVCGIVPHPSKLPFIAPDQPGRSRPGRRFRDRYEAAQRRHPRRGAGSRYALQAAAACCLLLGVLLLVTPGPSLPFLFGGAGLLATTSWRAARWLDFTEGRLRRWGRRLRPRWSMRLAGGQALGGAAGVVFAGAFLYLTCRYGGGG
jgi:hypothetical protein